MGNGGKLAAAAGWVKSGIDGDCGPGAAVVVVVVVVAVVADRGRRIVAASGSAAVDIRRRMVAAAVVLQAFALQAFASVAGCGGHGGVVLLPICGGGSRFGGGCGLFRGPSAFVCSTVRAVYFFRGGVIFFSRRRSRRRGVICI